MATREIAKQEPHYIEPDLDRELAMEEQEASNRRERVIARLALLWQERQFLIRCTAIGIVASILVALLIPARYTSTTRLMPPDQAGQGMASMLAALGKAGGELGSLGEELLGLKTSGDLFIGILHSRSVQDDLIDKFDLKKEYGVRRYWDARKRLENATDVVAERKSGIITIKVSDGNRDRAAAMAREYVTALNNIVITLNTSSAHRERIFLEKRLSEVRNDLEEAEKDFSRFASQNTAIDVKEQGRAMITAAAELEGQLIAAETQLEGLQQIYTSTNVRVRSLQARIDEYRRQLQKMGGQPSAEGGSGEAPESSTSGNQKTDLYPSMRELPVLGVTWADLYRRTKVEETVFETLTKQYELAKVEEAREIPSVKVLDPPDIPEAKSYPPRTILTLLGGILVFAGACAWVFGRAHWQQIDTTDPGKILAREVFEAARMRARKLFKRNSWPSGREGRTNPE